MSLHQDNKESTPLCNKPLVSIVIPTYNQNLDYLKTCIDSALNQTYANIEVIVSDNHSTNGTAKLLNEIKNVRLKMIKPEQFLSMIKNFSFAASFATGKYISFLSSDDFLMLDAIDKLVPLLEIDDSAVFAFGNIYASTFYNDNINDNRFLLRKDDNSSGVLNIDRCLSLFLPWSMQSTWLVGDLIRRDVYIEIGGFESCTYQINGDMWLTLELLGKGLCAYTSKKIAFYRLRDAGKFAADGDRRFFILMDLISFSQQILSLLEITMLPNFSKFKIFWYSFYFKIRSIVAALKFISGNSLIPLSGEALFNEKFNNKNLLIFVVHYIVFRSKILRRILNKIIS